MVEISINAPIFTSQGGFTYSKNGDPEKTFSLKTVDQLFEDHSDERDFRFNIHCPGGSTTEGFAIYDKLRTSGKNIYMNIEGDCHSMATVLLLAAPYENRSANPNSHTLIHQVRSEGFGTAEDMINTAGEIITEQNMILDIYSDRTHLDRKKLELLMKEEKIWSAQDLLAWGFISKINYYNTNQKTMDKKTKALKRVNDHMAAVVNFFTGKPSTVNYDFTDEAGDLLFSTEKEDETIEVGDTASPDGEFILPDGRVVIIIDGVIDTIEDVPDGEDLEELRTENADLKRRLTRAQNLLKEGGKSINELKNLVTSNYSPSRRVNSPVVVNKSRKEELKTKLNIK